MSAIVTSIFVNTLDDLHFSGCSREHYQVIRASGLLRQLFLDARNSLVNQANRDLKLKIRYGQKGLSIPFFELIDADKWDGIFPVPADRQPIENLKLDDFLGTKIGNADGVPYTIRQLIIYFAHVIGGIHLGSPDEDENYQKALYDFFGNPVCSEMLLDQIRHITRIVLVSLRPLRDSLLNLEAFDDAPGFSLCISLALHPVGDNRNNYILDLGQEGDLFSLSLFLDSYENLRCRIVVSGSRQEISAGPPWVAFHYGQAKVVTVRVGFLDGKIVMDLDVGHWSIVKLIQGNQLASPLVDIFGVIGSNSFGTEHTHMNFEEFATFSRFLSAQHLKELKAGLTRNLRLKRGSVFFRGNQFMYTNNHPKFEGQPQDNSLDPS